MAFFNTRAIIIVILANCLFQGILSQDISGTLFTGKFSQVPMTSFLSTMESGYPVRFYYKKEWFEKDTVSVNFENKTLDEVLLLVVSGKPYTYRILGSNQVVFLPREEVAVLVGQMLNYSSYGTSDEQFTLIGNLDEAGKNKSAALTGVITNGETGDPIIGATIQPENLPQGAVSNTDGYYKLVLTPGIYTLIVSSIGFEKAQYYIKIIGNGVLNIELFDKSVALDDIIIYGQRLDKNVSSNQMSLVELDKKGLAQLPSGAGGQDILKGLTVMPGVKSIGEFSSGINVRGGGEDQNLYLINAAPLFNTSHVFGLFSVVNPDAVDKLSLYKGHIPATYGERVSSVVEIRTKESPPDRIRINGGIGLYDSRLMVEVPVVKDRVYFDLGGRKSYSDWLLNSMKDYYLQNSKASFYDLNATLHANLGKNRFALSGYYSNDEFRFASEVSYQYGSKLGSVNWNYLINSNLASNLTLAYSEYNAQKDDISSTYMQSRITSGIQYGSLKYKIKYGGLQHHNIDAGFGVIRYQIQPGLQAPLDTSSLIVSSTLAEEQGYEGAVFLNDEFSIGNSLSFSVGLRYSAYAYTGPGSVAQYTPGMARDTGNITGYQDYGNNEVIKFYQGFEPRLSLRIRLSEESSMKMSYNRNIQYISLISYSSVTTPSDIWKLADPFISPLIANQYAIGYYHNFFNNTLETSVEAYYKELVNVVDFKDGAQLEMNPDIETMLINTNGRNYGIEFLVRKNSGKIDGWVTYTYSRSLRKTSGTFPEETINNNTYYPSAYDRPHDFSIAASYHLNKRLRFTANFSYSTGRPITLPEYKYLTGDDVVVYFSDKNKYRIPDYHRLDLTIALDESLHLKKRWKGSWSLSLLNVYGRENPYTIFYKKEDPSPANDYNKFSLYKLYLIGRPVPTITYSFMF
jgi:hypothetical protein